MSSFYTLSNKQGNILFQGLYPSFAKCVEHAFAQGVSLRHADFRNAALMNVTMDNADVSYADFRGANLTGANMSEIKGYRAIFTGADLYNCCFALADLRHGVFDHAHFGGTDFSGANISHCCFSGWSFMDIDFTATAKMQACLYDDRHYFSAPPLIIKGSDHPVFITDDRLRLTIFQLLKAPVLAAHAQKLT